MTAAGAPPLSAELNPGWLEISRYIEFLNESFPGKWDRTAFEWYMGREFNGSASDILVRAADDEVLSGMALCYRQIRVADESPIDVSVISTAATLPQERGRGHYHHLLSLALERSRERRCAAVLAFVTRENASGRGLTRVGARAIPSFYIIGRRERLQPLYTCPCVRLPRAADEGAVDELMAHLGVHRCSWRNSHHRPLAQFHYERAVDWRRQFIDRPHGVRRLEPAAHSVALIEGVDSTDRLQWLEGPAREFVDALGTVAALSRQAARDFFLYTLDARQAAAARRLGCEVRGGYLMLLPTGYAAQVCRVLAGASWHVQSGDRL